MAELRSRGELRCARKNVSPALKNKNFASMIISADWKNIYPWSKIMIILQDRRKQTAWKFEFCEFQGTQIWND